jgi:hypothetical protein
MNLSSHKPTMLTLNVLIFILAIAPSLRSEEPPFPQDSAVKMLNDMKSFEKQVINRAASCVCFLFEAGFDTIIRDQAWWHLSRRPHLVKVTDL